MRQGVQLPLDKLANVFLTTGRYAILHDGARRRQTITCNPAGRDVASFTADAQKAIADKVKMPAGVYVEFSGAAEQQTQAQRELLLHSLVAAGGIILLLAMVFRKASHLLLVLANLPFALVGGVLAIFLTGWLGGEAASLSLGTLVGFVTLFGITMRNSIMMISHFEHLVNEEGMAWGLGMRVARRDRAAGADCDDRARHGAGPAAAGDWQRRGRPRNRRPDGDRDSRRADHLDTAEFARAADARPALRTIRQSSTGGLICNFADFRRR